jgi:hypothetical protein
VGDVPVRLGRTLPAEIVLQDPRISRVHVELQVRDGGLVVRDLGSTNGTFVDGARIPGEMRLQLGAGLRVGGHLLTYELRSRRELVQARHLEDDLERASRYVRALLPPPIGTVPVQTSWLLRPSSKLGGDALGHLELDGGAFASYVLDVSGHGVGAAMHSVSLLNVLRQKALPPVPLRGRPLCELR